MPPALVVHFANLLGSEEQLQNISRTLFGTEPFPLSKGEPTKPAILSPEHC